MRKFVLIFERDHPADLDAYRTYIEEAVPEMAAHIRLAGSEADAMALGAECTAIVAKAPSLSEALIAAMPHLDWVQALTTGTDTIDAMNLPPHVTITSVRGIHAPQMSELAFLLMLSLTRDLPRMLRAQAQARWERRPQALLAGRTVLLVGIGLISEAIAARCGAFGMRVIGASGTRTAAPGFDRVFFYADLPDAAALADIVVVVAPYSRTTHHLVGAGVLARMKPSALFINIARGNVVDEAALIAALQAGAIAGAGLDVFATEPLPPESPFWSLPNVIVTPHIGGMSDCYAEQAAPILVANLRAYAAGNVPHGMTCVVRPGA